MTNKYRAPCTECRKPVEPRTGNLRRVGRRWLVTHRHDCIEDEIQGNLDGAQAAQERGADSAARAAGRADHSQWALAWELEQGNY